MTWAARRSPAAPASSASLARTWWRWVRVGERIPGLQRLNVRKSYARATPVAYRLLRRDKADRRHAPCGGQRISRPTLLTLLLPCGHDGLPPCRGLPLLTSIPPHACGLPQLVKRRITGGHRRQPRRVRGTHQAPVLGLEPSNQIRHRRNLALLRHQLAVTLLPHELALVADHAHLLLKKPLPIPLNLKSGC